MSLFGAFDASALSISNDCLIVICPPQIVTNYTCEQVFTPTAYPIVVSNKCTAQVTVSCNPPIGTPLPLGPTPIHCDVFMNGAITTSCDFMILVVRDDIPPLIRCPSNLVVHACPSPVACGATANFSVFASDNSGSVAVACNPPSGSFFTCGTNTVTCVAQDRCGNKTSCAFDVVVIPDGEVPKIQCPPDITVDGCLDGTIVLYPLPVVIAPGTSISCSPPSGIFFPSGTTTVTCVASNSCGADQCSFKVTVVPGNGQGPSIQCPSNVVVTACDAAGACKIVNYTLPVVSGGTLVGCNPPSGSCFPVGSTTVTCVATNKCGRNTCSFTVDVRLPQPPIIQCPSNSIIVTAPCGSNCVPVQFALPSVSGGLLESCNPPSGACLPVGTTTVTCRATNACGQTAVCEFDVRVIQGTGQGPGIQCPSNIVVNACVPSTGCQQVGYPLPLVFNGGLVGCTPPAGSCFPIGTTTVTCLATNACGSNVCAFTVTVRPIPLPTIQCPTNLMTATVPCGSNCVPVSYALPFVTGGALESCNPPSGSCLPPGVYVVTCRATNACGAAITCQFDVRVVQAPGQGPDIKCPSNIVVNACDIAGACKVVNYPLPLVGGGALVGCNPPSGSCFPLGTTTVTCLATNPCGSNICTFTIAVRDVPVPTIQCPTNIITAMVPCGSNCVPVIYPTPLVTGGVLVGCTPPSGSCLPIGNYTVTCRATNLCGQAVGCQFSIRVLPGDGTPPSLQCSGDIKVATCSNSAVVFYPAPAVNPAGTSVTCTPPSGSTFPVGSTTVICTASNGCGKATCSFVIAVRQLPPVQIQCPTNTIIATAPCASNCVPVFYPLPLVTDGALIGCNPPSGTCLAVGTHVVICRATNDCGSVAACEFVVQVVPGQGDLPHIQCASNIVVAACDAANGCALVNYPPPPVFNGALQGCNPPSGSCFPIGTTVVTCLATNGCGTNGCRFSVTVNPAQPPSIFCPSNVVLTAPCGADCVPVTYPLPAVTNGVFIGCNPPIGTCLKVGTYVVICRATNKCGLVASCEFNLQVVPGLGALPSINCASNIVVETCKPDCEFVTYPLPTVAGGALVGCNPPSGSCFPIGTTTVTCIATNGCGTNACHFAVTVRSSDPIHIQCPTNLVTIVAPCGSNCVPLAYPSPIAAAGTFVTCNPPIGTCLTAGVYVVTCQITNRCGQTAKCEFDVRVVPGQGEPPVIVCNPSNSVLVTTTCRTDCEIVNYALPTVFNGALKSCNPPPGTCFPIGNTVVTCVATNGCGSNSCSFSVFVRTIPFPELHCPSNIVVSTCDGGEVVKYPLPITPAGVVATCNPPPGTFFPVGTNRVTCCLTDQCNRTNCCDFLVIVRPGAPCVKPPAAMVLWLPFDEPIGPVAANIVPGGLPGFHANGPTPVLGSYVMNSLRFDGINDFVRVPSYGAIVLSASDMTIDAWMLRGNSSAAQGRQVIVSKLGQVFGAAGQRGYEFYMNNGVMNLLLAGVVAQNFNSGVAVPLDGNWHHVAVTVQRSGFGAVRFYLDGGLVSSQFGPITAPLGNNNSLLVGAGSFPVPNAFYSGILDELEIFRRALAPAEVFALWNARQSGKCKIECKLPPVVTFKPNALCVTVNAQVCNNSGVPQTITWSLSGGLIFPTASGTVVLPPFTCTNVPVVICRSNSVPFSAVPWTLSLISGTQCPTLCSSLAVDLGVIGVDLPTDPVIVAGTNRAAIVHCSFDGLPLGTQCRVRIVGHDMEPDTQFCSLNGLPPGTPYLLDAEISAGFGAALKDGTTQIDTSVIVGFADMDPVGDYSAIVEADLDGDGIFETPLGSFGVQNPVVTPPSIRIENGQLWWDDTGDGLGVIESADSLDGPWTPVGGGPGTPIDKTGGMKFYRISVPAE